MHRRAVRGFSMVELAIVLVIFGIIVGFGVPMMTGYRQSHMVKIAKENIAGQLRLAREKAITSGATQELRFKANFQGADYHVWNGSAADPKWKLPTGIRYLWSTGTQDTFRLTSDGRCMDSGMIIVQDSRGVSDTVSVQRSGVILAD
jgi:prepilin-type N-terminal cleavage/methylation domain-containing protein